MGRAGTRKTNKKTKKLWDWQDGSVVKKACWAATWPCPEPSTQKARHVRIYEASFEESRDKRIDGVADFRSEKMEAWRDSASKEYTEVREDT